MQIYRQVKELEAQGLLKIEKIGGLLFVAAPLDLILLYSKTQTPKENGDEDVIAKLKLRRASSERREAVLLAWETEWGEGADWEEEIKPVIEESEEEVKKLFLEWYERVSRSYVVLRAVDERVAPSYRVLRYRTRFTDGRRKAEAYARYNEAWRRASERHREGVFLTLTVDPSRFGGWWEAVKAVSRAWNSFRSWICKRHKLTSFDYVRVSEFTKAGLLHLHCLLYTSPSPRD